MHPSSRRPPSGMTLLEVSGVLALIGVFLGVSTSLLYAMLDHHRAMHERADVQRDVLRLAACFRQDIHRGTHVQHTPLADHAFGDDATPLLRIMSAQGDRIEYGRRGSEILRVTLRDQQRIAVEAFRIAKNHAVLIDAPRGHDQQVIRLVLDPIAFTSAKGIRRTAPVAVEVTAILGFTTRHTSPLLPRTAITMVGEPRPRRAGSSSSGFH